jgi:hypothetical protein
MTTSAVASIHAVSLASPQNGNNAEWLSRVSDTQTFSFGVDENGSGYQDGDGLAGQR